ncbi:CPBP family intramembrane metalloprotease [Ornithinimicrobium sufpigmenti]|uniref:CPBP family intramembrane metalloprotease n=1 Tax=Ornithinimicrobium sufpigmenti TaxID=2508882 RepID=UPI001036A392|nr:MULTISPECIES: CPBP family intramembrane metalloprotease [unclassified Ornithinimicrobium]
MSPARPARVGASAPPVALVHGLVPWAIAAGARGRGPAAWVETCTRHPQRTYDVATLLLAALAAARGHRGGTLAAVATGIWLGAPRPASAPALTCSVATAEEVIWRGVRTPAWSVVMFALLHAPAHPRRWPYHLLTGAVLHGVASHLGVTAAALLHAVHNLAVERRAALATRAARESTAGAGTGAAPALDPAVDW